MFPLSHCRLFPALAAVLLLGGCGRAPESAGAAKSAAAVQRAISPAQAAREFFAAKNYFKVLPTLGSDRSPAALDLCLEMLTLDPQQISYRCAAVELLEQWPDQHERIVTAFAAHLERAFWVKELEAIARAFAKWGQPAHAEQFAQYFAQQADLGLLKGAASGLEHLLSPSTVPVLLACVPAALPAPTPGRQTPLDRANAERTRLALTLLGRIPAPAGVLKFATHLRASTTHVSGPAAIALGRTGTEAAVTTLEQMADDRRNPTLAKLALEGLFHAAHPRARARVAAALSGTDRLVAMSAAAALVATASPVDAPLVARGLASPRPHLRQRLLECLPALLPGGSAALASAAVAALAAGRPRTALFIAEAIGQADLVARARSALDALVGQLPPGADLGRWLDCKKEDLDPAFAGLQSSQESKHYLVGDLMIMERGAYFLRNDSDTLRFFRTGAVVVRVLVRQTYADPVAGVRLGTTADRVWELHGPSDLKITGWLDYELPSGKRAVRFTYYLDEQERVTAIDVRHAQPKS